MSRAIIITALLIAAVIAVPNARASSGLHLTASLDGSQEVPPVVSTGQGVFSAAINDVQTEISFTLTVGGLNLSKITASHIHVGPIGVNGPIILFLFNRATEGIFTGTKSGTLTATDLIPRPAQGVNTFADAIHKILTGNTYVNVHTEAHPGGEIRGQVQIVLNIDVKPGSDPNRINVRSLGVVPVAVLSSSLFDATTVDPSTVTFGRTGTEASPELASMFEDVDGDGLTDLVLHFETQQTLFVAGDTVAVLNGRTFDGGLVTGTDSIQAFFPGDVNGDHMVNVLDLVLVGVSFGAASGSSRYNLNADFNEDGVVNILDMVVVGAYFGQHA